MIADPTRGPPVTPSTHRRAGVAPVDGEDIGLEAPFSR